MRYLRQASAGEPPYRMAALVALGLLTLPRVMNESFAGHCEVAQRLAGRLGLGELDIFGLLQQIGAVPPA